MLVEKLKNTLRSILLAVCSLCLMSFTVVIDAGHGGDDLGAVGLVKGIKEKDLNLTVAKQLAEKISQKYPDVKVVLTRNTDIFLPLQKRADIANKNHADLFISIHTNAAENRKAQGAETFILGANILQHADVIGSTQALLNYAISHSSSERPIANI